MSQPEEVQKPALPVYEWKAMWMHKEWQPMPNVHDEDAAVKFLESKMPHSEESHIRVNGGPALRWTPPKKNVIHGMNCSCCPDWS